MATFPLLADPAGYVACPVDLSVNTEQREYWIGLFRNHIDRLVDEAQREYGDLADIEQRGCAIHDHFNAYLDDIAAHPERHGRLDIITICAAREAAIKAGGLTDVYRGAKQRENAAALPLLGVWLGELDQMPDADRARRLIEGVFAGNLFDLGATQALDRLGDKPVNFYGTLDTLGPRPWLIDSLDAWIERFAGRSYRSAVMFVDNVGCDIVLGMIPLARELLRRGGEVLMTANTWPSLNDVTYDELCELLDKAAGIDDVIAGGLRDGRLTMVASGNGLPLIDLSAVADELAEAVGRRNVDLLVIEGMGRAIESNLDTPFICDTLKIAMIKDAGVARWLGGQVYDLVMKFEQVQ